MRNLRTGALLSQLCISAVAGAMPPVAESGAPGELIHHFDFAGEESLPARAWLESQDFLLKQHATHSDKIDLYHAEGALHVRAKEAAFGLILHELDINGANHVRMHWGVSTYPAGASYQHGIDNEAIMVYVFFGDAKIPSGSIFIPDSPYFIGFFLCPPGSDNIEQPYVGHHYKKSGRYICVDHPPSGATIVTELDLAQEFIKSFGRQEVPAVSGISIEVDTTDSGNDGKAAAFLKRIEFLQ